MSHEHSEECYEEHLICQKEEHTHTLACFSNPEADVETAEVWEETFPEKLEGTTAENLVAVVQSQVGYKESSENYEVAEDEKTKLGYTRYGAWAGEPYANWSLDFISFCLNYSGVNTVNVADGAATETGQIPVDTTSEEKWLEAAEKAGLDGDEFEVGSLVFMSEETIDGVGTVPHMGIVTGVDGKKVTIVEGDRDDAVIEKDYQKDSDQIIALVNLPVEEVDDGTEVVTDEAAAEETADSIVAEDQAAEEAEDITTEDGAGQTDAEQMIEERAEESIVTEDISGNPEPESDVTDTLYKTLTFTGEGYSVIASYTSNVLPVGTELTVSEIRSDGNFFEKRNYKKYYEQIEEKIGGSISSARFFDIAFENEGKEIEPSGDVKVAVTMDEAVSGDVQAVHIPDGKDAEVIDSVADGNEVSFTADEFSVYGVVYTVDFAYTAGEETYCFSIDGGERVALSKLVEVLGILDDTNFDNKNDFIAHIDNVTFTDETLVKVSKNMIGNDWILTSLQPFDTEETLTITMQDGSVITVDVTDAATVTSDMSSLLTNVVINAPTNSQGEYVVYEGQEYGIRLSFKEKNVEGGQFDMSSPFSYTLPAGITMPSGASGGTIDITLSGGANAGKTVPLAYSFSTDSEGRTVMTFTWPKKGTPEFQQLAEGLYAGFNADIKAIFNQSYTELKFSDTITRNLDVKNDGKAHVSKIGTYNAKTNCVDYTVTVRSEGGTSNVVVNDKISGTALTYNKDAVAYSDVYNNVQASVQPTTNSSNNGFEMKIPSMTDGQQIVIKYSAAVDLNSVTFEDGVLGTVSQTGNTVKVKSDTSPEEKDEKSGKDFTNKISYSSIGKSGTVGETGEDGKATITWTIKANSDTNVSMAGHTISDMIQDGSQQYMKYSGTGITITRRDADRNVVGTPQTIPWSSLTSHSDSAWTWMVPNSSPDTQKLSYEITYTTEADVSDRLVATNVKNTAGSDNGGTTSSDVNITPPGGGVTAHKKVVSRDLTNKTITWEVNFDVPAEGLESAQVVDTLPNLWDYRGNLIGVDNYIEDSIVLTTDLEAGESWEASSTTGDDGKEYLTIDFYKMVDGQKITGLTGTGEKRRVRVQFQTKIDEDWVNAVDTIDYAKTHTNNADVFVNAQKISVSASTTINGEEPGMSKIHEDQFSRPKNGDNLTIFPYYVILTGISEDSFDENGQMIIEDNYNSKYLDYYTDIGWEGEQAVNGHVFGAEVLKDTDRLNDSRVHQGPSVVSKTSDGTLKIRIERDTIPVDGNNSFYPYYMVYYYLTVKDKVTQDKLNSTAASNEGGIYTFYNTVENEIYGSTTDAVDYHVPVVTKTADNAELVNGNYEVKYHIKVNQDGLQLGDDSEVTLTDDYTNIAVDYTTVKIYECTYDSYGNASNKVEATGVSWNRQGNTVTYTLKNGQAYLIEYTARISGKPGDDGKVTYTNTAEVHGSKSTITKTQDMSSSGGGSSVTYGMQIFKHVKGSASEPLPGTVFKLWKYTTTQDTQNGYENRPNRRADPTGWVEAGTLTTGADGVARTGDISGLQMQHWTWYALEEITAPTKDGVSYVKKDFDYMFWITDSTTSDYSKYVYFNDDVVAIDNSPEVPEKVSITATKTWAGDDEDTSMRKDVTFRLYADGYPYGEGDVTDQEGNVLPERTDAVVTRELKADGTTESYTWTDLPGGPVYSVVEDPVPGYTTSYSPRNSQLSGTIAVTNTKIPNKTAIQVEKAWATGTTKAEDVTVQLKRYVSSKVPVTVKRSSDGYTLWYTNVNSGKSIKIKYTWKLNWGTQEVTCKIYNKKTGEEIKSQTNSLNEGDSATVEVSANVIPAQGIEVVFLSNAYLGDGSVGEEGSSIVMEVSETGGSGGGAAAEDAYYTNEKHLYTLNADNNWSLIIDRLPLSDDDGTYTYYVEEVGVNDNTETPEEAGYSVSYSNYSDGAFTGVTDTTTPITVTNDKQTGSLNITKNVTLDGDPTTNTDADGIYTFLITDADGNPAEGKVGETDLVDGKVEITIENGESQTVEVTGLTPGTYTVHELASDNRASLVLINDEDAGGRTEAEVVVEANKTGEAAPVVSFTNNVNTPAETDLTTNLSVSKKWMKGEDDVTSQHNDETVTFKVKQYYETVDYIPVKYILYNRDQAINTQKYSYVPKGTQVTFDIKRNDHPRYLLIKSNVAMTKKDDTQATYASVIPTDFTSYKYRYNCYGDMPQKVIVNDYVEFLLQFYYSEDRVSTDLSHDSNWDISESFTKGKASSADTYDSIDALINAKVNTNSSAYREYTYTLMKDSASKNTGAIGTITSGEGTWTAQISDLPQYERVSDGQYKIYKYEISEVSVTDGSGKDVTSDYASDVNQTTGEITNTEVGSSNIKIKKLDENGAGLANATFQLLAVDNSRLDVYNEAFDGKYSDIKIDGQALQTININTKGGTGGTPVYSAFKTTGNEQIISGLPNGIYVLREVEAPAGYVIELQDIQFTVTNGVISDVIESPLVQKDETGDILILKITNTPGAALPSTGGAGARLFTLLGSLLILGAGAVFFVGRRRKVIG